jgi:hypothetical protein
MNRFQKVEAVFKRLDKDGSGDIDKSELKRFFKKAVGENHFERNNTARKLIEYFDKDGDGLIDLEEFKLGCKNLERGEGAAFLKSKLQFFFENERIDPKDGQLKPFTTFIKDSKSKAEAQARGGGGGGGGGFVRRRVPARVNGVGLLALVLKSCRLRRAVTDGRGWRPTQA